jgi:Uncharacterized protein conserved in bacteria
MKSGRRKFCACATLLLLLLSGCLNLQVSPPQKQYYLLDIARPGEVPPPNNGPVLQVQGFRASPLFAGNSFVYQTGTLAWESDFYNAFFTSPAAIVTEQVRDWLAASGLFSFVLSASSGPQASYILEGQVSALYGDYSTPGAPKAVMGIDLLLTQQRSAHVIPVFQRGYRKETGLDHGSPEDLVRGWSRALGQILTRFEADLREVNALTLTHEPFHPTDF